jgi:hypothetical protein
LAIAMGLTEITCAPHRPRTTWRGSSFNG